MGFPPSLARFCDTGISSNPIEAIILLEKVEIDFRAKLYSG